MRRTYIILLSIAFLLNGIFATEAATPQTQTFIERGVSLFNFGRWVDARNELLKAREGLSAVDLSERQKVDFYLAACAVELGSKDAEQALLNFSEKYPASIYNNDVLFSLASYYCTQNNMSKTKELFSQVDYDALSSKRKEQYDVRMGYVEFSLGDYDKAYDYFNKISSGSEYAHHALYYKSYIAYSRGDYAQAKRGFQSLAKSDAYAPLVPFYLLQIEFKEGNYQYVVDNGDALLQSAVPQQRREIGRVMAESWFHLENYGKTIEYLNLYAQSDQPFGRDENYLMGFSLYRTARYSEAEEYLRKACGADDELTQNASFHLADCYLRRSEKRLALQSFAMASNDLYDKQIAEESLFNYGKLQYELGDEVFNEAINVLSRYIMKYPESDRLPQVRELLIAAYYNSNNYDAAYEAIKLYPNPDANIRGAMQKIAYFRGLESYKSGDLDAAQQYLAESAAVSVSPKYNALNLFWQGEIAFARGDYDKANAKYDEYIKRAPKSAIEYAMAHYNQGYCAFSKHNMAQAQSCFERFLSQYKAVDAYRADAYNRLGDTYYAERRFEEAIKQYDDAIAMRGSESDYARYQRAITLGVLGRTDSKISELRKIIDAGRGEYVEKASYELGHTYIGKANYSGGARVLERFVADYPNSTLRAAALSELGLAHLNLGDKQTSLKYYDMVISASPKSAEAKDAMQGIREIYVSDGNVDAYFGYAEKVGMQGDITEMSRDSLSFTAAQKLYMGGRSSDAEKSLRSYIKSYPKGYYINDALYYLSDCYLKSDNREEAVETLIELTANSTNQYTATALERLSRMTFDDKRYEESAQAYRKLYDVAVVQSAKQSAMTGYVRATLAQNDIAKTEAMATDVAAQDGAGVTARRESQFALAQILSSRGEHEKAMGLYRQLSVEVHSVEGAASAYYLIDDVFNSGDMKKTEVAIYTFTDKNSEQTYWLARAYILLGDVYARQGDTFQARATYQSIADGYSTADDGIAEMVKERIQKLN